VKSLIGQAKGALRIDDRELVWKFFLAFSRFEYALKCSRYVRQNRDGAVFADWQRFASTHRKKFTANRDNKVRMACVYFTKRPPRQQILVHGVLGWRNSNPLGNTPLLCWLVLMLARVRNNLFHGGKFPWQVDPCRNSTLVRHALVLLEAFADLDASVKHYFVGPN